MLGRVDIQGTLYCFQGWDRWFYEHLFFMLTDEHHPASLVEYLSTIQMEALTDVGYCS